MSGVILRSDVARHLLHSVAATCRLAAQGACPLECAPLSMAQAKGIWAALGLGDEPEIFDVENWDALGIEESPAGAAKFADLAMAAAEGAGS